MMQSMVHLLKNPLSICFLLIANISWAQDQLNYLFNTDQGIYEPLVDASLIWQDSIFAEFGYVQVPTFDWNGVQIDSIAVSSNGWIRLGTFSGSALEKHPFQVDSSLNAGLPAFTIVGFGHLLINSDIAPSAISYQINEQSIVFEYKNVRRYSAEGESINFQIHIDIINESVHLVYGDIALGTFPSILDRELDIPWRWNYNRVNIGLSAHGYLMLKTNFGAPWSELSYDVWGSYGCMLSNTFPSSIPASGFTIHFERIEGIVGCMNELATNYNPEAEFAGWCKYDGDQTGCMDPVACDYDVSAIYEGTCDYDCYGCMDPMAWDYTSFVTTNIDNCVYSTLGIGFNNPFPVPTGELPWCHLWSTYLGSQVVDGASPQALNCAVYSILLSELTNLQVECPATYGSGELSFWLFEENVGYADFDDDSGLGWLPKLQFIAEPNVNYNLAVCGWGYDYTSYLLEVKQLPLCEVNLPQLSHDLCYGSVGSFYADLPTQYDPYWIVNESDTLTSPSLSHGLLTEEVNSVRLLSDYEYCPLDTLYQVNILPPPSVIVPNDTVVCRGDMIQLNAESEWPVFWNWQLPNFSTVTVNSTFNYIARTVNDQGCVGRDTLHVTALSIPNPSISQIDQNLQTIGTNVNNQWLLNGEQIDGANGLTYTPNEDGFYSLTQNIGSCFNTSEQVYFDYIRPECLDFIAPDFPSSICEEQEWQFTFDAAVNDSFQWIINGEDTTFNGLISSELLNSGWNELTLYTALEDCPIIFTDEVNYYLGPTFVEILSDSVICTNDYLFLDAEGSSEVMWSFDLEDESFIQILFDTTLVASVMNQCNLIVKDTLHVNALAPPTLQVLPFDQICEGEDLYHLFAEGNGEILWGAHLNDSFISVYQDTLLYVNSTSTEGCIVTDSLEIDVVELPLSQLTFSEGDLIAPDATSYLWFFNGEPVTTATENWFPTGEEGYYQVLMTNAIGCEIMSEVFNYISTVELNPLQFDIFPNPSSQNVTIVWKNELSDLKVVNSIGETVISVNSISSPYVLPVSGWSNGLYFAIFNQNNKSTCFPLLKQE